MAKSSGNDAAVPAASSPRSLINATLRGVLFAREGANIVISYLEED